MNTSALTIANTLIKQDENNLFCLNDLHKAAGNEPKFKPSLWLRSQQSKDLISELSTYSCLAPIEVHKGGKTPGTFVVKELVYAYAMWISPSFHLAVIRAYDALVTQPTINLTDFQVDQIVKQLSLKLGDSLRFGVRRNWTALEDKTAIELRKSGYGMTRIGYALGRSAGSVKGRFETLVRTEAKKTEQSDLFLEV